MTAHQIKIMENAKARQQHDEEMMVELHRVKNLLATRGITVVHDRSEVDDWDRIVTVENYYDYHCRIMTTCFKVPEGIDLEKVVWWFVHKTKYSDCTVFLKGFNPTTIYGDSGIEYLFKRYKKQH